MSGTDAPHHATLVDAHVHFHSCFDAERFLSSAREHFAAAAAKLGIRSGFNAYLLLTESAEANWFAQLKERSAAGWRVAEHWTVQPTADDRELSILHSDGAALRVVAGRQIATAERLEVLALGTPTVVPDGYPLTETLRHVTNLGAIAVIPWGFGKWLGGRGARVREILETAEPGRLFLGDNAGRLAGMAEPPLFQLARAKGVGILPGTDPFPFRRETRRVGRMGFVVRSSQELSDWQRLREAILGQSHLAPYGELERPLRFALNQTAMQLRMRFARRRVPA